MNETKFKERYAFLNTISIFQFLDNISKHNIASKIKSKEFKASLAIECESRVAMMADVANILADMRVMINAINTRDIKNGNTVIYLTITVKSIDFLNIVISKLNGISGVENVTRSKN